MYLKILPRKGVQKRRDGTGKEKQSQSEKHPGEFSARNEELKILPRKGVQKRRDGTGIGGIS